jgi:hypothetical protein
MNIYKIPNIDLDNLIFTEHKQKNNLKIISIEYNDKSKNKTVPFIIQTSEIYCASSIEKINNDNVLYQLDLPLYCKSTRKTEELNNFFVNLNKKLKNYANSYNSKLKYKSLIRGSRTGNNKIDKYESLRLKFLDNDKYKTYVFDENKNTVDPYKVLKANTCYVRALVEITALWISGGNIGIITRLHQLGISKNNEYISTTDTYAFIESEEDMYSELVVDTEIEGCEQKQNDIIIKKVDNINNIVLSETSNDDEKHNYNDEEAISITSVDGIFLKNEKNQKIDELINQLNITDDNYPII